MESKRPLRRTKHKGTKDILNNTVGVYKFINTRGTLVTTDKVTALNAISYKTTIDKPVNENMKGLMKRYQMIGRDLVDLQKDKPINTIQQPPIKSKPEKPNLY